MQIGNILTVIVSFGVGIIGSCVYFFSLAVNEKYKRASVRSFAHFWLFMSGVWYFTGVANLIRFLGYQSYSLYFVYVLQFFLGISMIFGALFVDEALFLGKGKRGIGMLYGMLFAIFITTLFMFDLVIPVETYFSDHVLTSVPTRVVFVTMFFPLWLSALFMLVKTALHRNEDDVLYFRFLLLSALSLVILGLAGFMDEIGLISNWVVTLLRIFSLSSALCGLIAMIVLRESGKELEI